MLGGAGCSAAILNDSGSCEPSIPTTSHAVVWQSKAPERSRPAPQPARERACLWSGFCSRVSDPGLAELVRPCVDTTRRAHTARHCSRLLVGPVQRF